MHNYMPGAWEDKQQIDQAVLIFTKFVLEKHDIAHEFKLRNQSEI